METIGTSCYTSNFNYVGYSPFATSSPSYANLTDGSYDIKTFDQYPYVLGAGGLVSQNSFSNCAFLYLFLTANLHK